ncbi:uncharacterized protein LOC124890798 [Capsicum annuum]|uniref:uncharacterized protein LOC124890798 n=1 Tax=Capsicum annuum TaxID=4072 RepID=UPI001FB0A181|nr:uncharacterized protein LOC124890798 [Capsicum annuum]
MQGMKESETIKDYSDKLLLIVNKERILGTELNDNRIVQKILVTLLERYEATIALLENTKDMRQEGSIEGALQAKLQLGSDAVKGNKGKGKKGNYGNSEATSEKNAIATTNNKEGKYPPCQHCRRRNHPHFKCWRKPDMK